MSLLRTAVRANVAANVIGRTHRRQQQRWAAQDAAAAQQAAVAQPVASAPPAPPQAAPTAPSMIDQLTQLAALRDSGVLSPAEFEAAKQRVLAGA